MNNQAQPWPLVDYLIWSRNLNECEAADLSDRAQRLLDFNVGRNDTSKDQFIKWLWVQADTLDHQGSPMQPTWDMLARAKNELSQNPHKSSQTMNL